MIDMGIDIWQGVMNTNNIPELIKEYGGKISFMGGIHSGQVDFPAWTPEIVADFVEKACRDNGKLYFIPCQTSGLPIDNFEGVYTTVSKEIDRMSTVLF
ncbi:MAG: uroporphyrinogen decarboxylase, partial [Acetobacterium sp.]|nr:uroporphyrinogen decarboxylase [Bacillota bacterium]MCG2729558.1 uroporphyrinogen decarboxylase [Acetobacterium sp.]